MPSSRRRASTARMSSHSSRPSPASVSSSSSSRGRPARARASSISRRLLLVSCPAGTLRQMREPGAGERVVRGGDRLGIAQPRAVGTDHHVVEQRQAREAAHDLEGAADAEPRDAVQLQSDQRVPSSVAVPALAGSTPFSTLNSVVLPAPFGPMMPRMVPARHLEAHVVHGLQAAECLGRARRTTSSGGPPAWSERCGGMRRARP